MSTFEPRTGPRHGKAVATLLYLLFGPLVWAAHLTIGYGAHTLACAKGGGPALAAWIVSAATAVGVAILIGAMVYAVGRRRAAQAADEPVRRFEHDVMGLLALLSTAGVVWGGATVLFVSPCMMLR
jgi:hypothetical protein